MSGIVLPIEPSWCKSVFHLYVIRVRDRDRLRKCLAQAGIGFGLHYPRPLHLQNAHSNLQYSIGDFPVSEKLAEEILSLPMFPQLQPEQQSKVLEHVSNYLLQTVN